MDSAWTAKKGVFEMNWCTAGHGKVIDGCCDVLCEVLGDEVGKGVRTCVGCGSLGGAVTVDLEVRVRD